MNPSLVLCFEFHANYKILNFADKSKYGYRMLQRMGWEEGKGLGSKEEGTREHIKVKVKRDNQGML